MRKITQEAVSAFENGYEYKKANTIVKNDALYLHGNKIAQKKDGELWITNAGWSSHTTKERLNGLRGVKINQKNFDWYLNGELWDGNWIKI